MVFMTGLPNFGCLSRLLFLMMSSRGLKMGYDGLGQFNIIYASLVSISALFTATGWEELMCAVAATGYEHVTVSVAWDWAIARKP